LSEDSETEKKIEEIQEKRIDAGKSASDAAKKASEAEKESAAAEEDFKLAQQKLSGAKKAADAAALQEYEIAAAVAEAKAGAAAGKAFSDKHKQDIIFRRELGEPEFFRYKHELIPKRKIYTSEEEMEVSRIAQIPTNQIPVYKPENILSPEYHGISNYESGVELQKQEILDKLQRLKNDPDVRPEEIRLLEEDLKTLDSLFENFYIGMNVFRTAKGGRNKLEGWLVI